MITLISRVLTITIQQFNLGVFNRSFLKTWIFRVLIDIYQADYCLFLFGRMTSRYD